MRIRAAQIVLDQSTKPDGWEAAIKTAEREADIDMWAYESVFYQIYPLGFCGAPFENDGELEHRILKV